MSHDEQFLAELAESAAQKFSERRAAEIEEWCRLKTWTVEEGLLLVHGVAPRGAEVQWGKLVSVGNARPLDSHELFLAIPAPTSRLLDVRELPGGSLVGNFEMDEDEAKTDKLNWLRDIEQRLLIAWRRWQAEELKNTRYAPKFFVEWARENGIDPPLAISNRLVGSVANKMIDNERLDKSASRSIGALERGPERDREIFEYQNSIRKTGAKDFQAQTAEHFGVSTSAIKQAVERHKMRSSGEHEGHSIRAQLLAAASKEK